MNFLSINFQKSLFSFAVLLSLASFQTILAQKDLRTVRDSSAQKEIGVALLIGNSAYKYATVLNSPANDAEDMGRVLQKLGFKVIQVRKDATLQEMENAVAEFGHELAVNKGVGIFYYSGHGVQSNGANYLVPVDAYIPAESFLRDKALNIEVVLATMQNSTESSKIIILDACRNNPFEKSWRVKGENQQGLAQITASQGTLIAYATSPDDVARDGNGRNSPYTETLLQEIIKSNVRIGEMFGEVRSILNKRTNGDQIPWESTSLIGRFCFAGCSSALETPSISPISNRNAEVQTLLNSAEKFKERKEYESAIRAYTDVIKLDNQNSNAFVGRCNSLFLKDNPEQAIDDCNEAIRLSPDSAQAYLYRGMIYALKENQFELAFRDFNRAVELNPKLYEAFLYRGNYYHNKDKINEAIADFDTVIRLKSDYAQAYVNRGHVHFYHQNNEEKAVLDLTKAIELMPNDPETYATRGQLYNDIGESYTSSFNKDEAKSVDFYNKAILDVTKAINLKPDYFEAYYLRITIYTDVKKDYVNALKDANKIIEIKPAIGYGVRGAIYEIKGDFEQAVRDFSKSIELKPDFAPAYISRANVYEKMGKKTLAEADQKRAAELENKSGNK